jgi:hypothetical protein
MNLRNLVPFVVVALLVLAAAMYAWRGGYLRSAEEPTLPLDLKNLIPQTWSVQREYLQQCNFDSDSEEEWLLLYRYDKSKELERELIGGVIFDAQVNRASQEPGNQSPYRPAFLVPYKLLPDIYTGKGQGYLGETRAAFKTYPAPERGKPCQAQEIAIWGYSGDSHPTRLSIFRWGGEAVGYRGVHFAGNARVTSAESAQFITEVTTYNRLNDRSALCDVQVFSVPTRAGAIPSPIEASEKKDARTIDFCFGAPQDPAYPEGVVVALLRGQSPNDDTPTGASFLTSDASIPTEIVGLKGSPRTSYRIVAISHPGTLAPHPGPGKPWRWTPPVTPAAEQQTWWRGRERAEVTAEIILNGAARQIAWHLASIANERVNTDVRWRVERVEWK